MLLENVYLVIQSVAGLAVIASLLYVGIQIRQNTRATRLAAVQAVQAAIGRTEELIIQDNGFAEILKHGLSAGTRELADTDRIRLNVFYRHALRTYQSAHYQYRNSALEASVWEPQAKALAAIFQADRGLREHFEIEKYMLDPIFVDFCQRLQQGEQRWLITSAHEPTAQSG